MKTVKEIISARVDPEILKEIEKIARKEKKSISEVVNALLGFVLVKVK